jgi:hypothetical protein
VAYILAGNGLFVHRNHRFFSSCVPARRWPAELSGADTFIRCRYPRLDASLLQTLVGFFAAVALRHGAEAMVMLVWDEDAQNLRLQVPDQCCQMTNDGYGPPQPVGLTYARPDLPGRCRVIGDVHSHVDGEAYTSGVDRWDEHFRPGLHVVVGRIHDEPPQFHAAAVVDGFRFTIDPAVVLDLKGYGRRASRYPDHWMRKLRIEQVTLGAWPAGENGGATFDQWETGQRSNRAGHGSDDGIKGQDRG